MKSALDASFAEWAEHVCTVWRDIYQRSYPKAPMTTNPDAPPPALGPDPSSRCPDCGRQLAAGHDVDCAAIAAPIVRERFSKPDAPPPALGELARRATADAAYLHRVADGSFDDVDIDDRVALRSIADRILQLVALATGGAETAKLPWGCSRCGSELFTGEQKSGICGDCAVTRFEVIDHRKDGNGRIFAAWDASVELSYQDGGRTLKVFVVDGVATPEPRAR